MNNSICFDRTFLIMLILAITAISLYNYYIYDQTIKATLQKCPSCPSTSSSENTKIIVNKSETHPTIPHLPIIPPTLPLVNPLREYDRRTLEDPLVPPFKRTDYDINPAMMYPTLFSYPTRGGPTAFKKMGTLTDSTADNSDKFKFLLLMGRQKYNNGPYEYYATATNKEDNIKFDLESIRKELNTGDKVTISQLNKEYTVTIDRTLGFEYSPFIF